MLISIQPLFTERFHGLLEGAAEEMCAASRALTELLATPSLGAGACAAARARSERLAEAVTRYLVATPVAGLEREDIADLAQALSAVLRMIDRMAARFVLVSDKLAGADLEPLAHRLGQATELVAALVRQLRHLGELEQARHLSQLLRGLTDEADQWLASFLNGACQGSPDALKLVALEDLARAAEQVLSHCRRAGEVVLRVFLQSA